MDPEVDPSATEIVCRTLPKTKLSISNREKNALGALKWNPLLNPVMLDLDIVPYVQTNRLNCDVIVQN